MHFSLAALFQIIYLVCFLVLSFLESRKNIPGEFRMKSTAWLIVILYLLSIVSFSLNINLLKTFCVVGMSIHLLTGISVVFTMLPGMFQTFRNATQQKDSSKPMDVREFIFGQAKGMGIQLLLALTLIFSVNELGAHLP